MPQKDINEMYARQLDIFNPTDVYGRITLIGAGSVGSVTAHTLAWMGIKNFEIFDHDKVEIHNCANQCYPPSLVGKYKVDALSSELKRINPLIHVRTHKKKFTSKTKISPDIYRIVITAVDSKPARRIIYRKFLRDHPIVKGYIDTRSGGEGYSIFCVDLSSRIQKERYEKSLKGKGANIPCTESSIIYNMYHLSSKVAWYVKQILTDQPRPFQSLFRFGAYDYEYYPKDLEK